MSDDESLGTVERFGVELGRTLEPLVEAQEDGIEGITALLVQAGVEENLLEDVAGSIEDAFDQSVLDTLSALLSSESEVPDHGAIVDAVDSIYGGIRALEDDIPPEADDIGGRLLDFLLVTYLERHRGGVHSTFVLLGVIDIAEDHPSIDLSVIPEILEDPLVLSKGVTNWANEEEDFLAFFVLYYLKQFFWTLGVPASLTESSSDTVTALTGVDDADLPNAESDQDLELRVPLLVLADGTSSIVAGFKLVPLPGGGEYLPGLAVVTFGELGTHNEWELGEDWVFNVESSGELGARGFTVRPHESDGVVFDTVSVEDGVTTDEFNASAALEYLADGDETVLLGQPEGSRLAITTVSVRVDVTYTEDEGVEFRLALPTSGTVGVSPADFDGFLERVLPEEGFVHDFETEVGWSTADGLYLDSGGGLSATLPQQVEAGPLTIEEVYLAAMVDVDDSAIAIEGSATASLDLGPLTASVERLGITADVHFPDEGGNLGPLDLDIGFSPPTGVGISIDAGAVVGGGHLSFEPEHSRYSGVLQLTVGELTLSAIGLLTTELPDGRDGYSLLLIITGEFPPVQLGFGFTLNAVGGLFGVNRTMEVDVLRSGVRDGTTRSVLFPEDPVRNATQIVSDLRSVFPPANGQHVFGPMARLGWGSPTIMSADIGVLLELPEPVRLVILGRLHAALPDEDAALIVFNMDAVGVVDFDEREASVDATLYDSRVIQYTLAGDMAMRTNWGDDPDFVLAVGGFNPRYDPPEGFPELQRVSLSLGADNPLLRCAGYFAITSNTAQFGAGVELYAEAGKFSVDGHMGFDALFYFDPFEFIIDFAAGFTVKRNSRSLLTVDLDGTLSGPTPWHVHGEASFKIGFVSFSVSVDVEFGDDEQPPPLSPADVRSKLEDALADERNWSAQVPPTTDSIVTLRDVEAEAGTVLAHPLGKLEVRQTVVPLDLEIDTFGNAQPETFDTFSIESVTADDDSPDAALSTRPVAEQFAPAEYIELSEEDKLDGPSYEAYEAGKRIVTDAVGYGGAEDDLTAPTREWSRSTADLRYDTDIIDESAETAPVEWREIAMPDSTATALASCSAVARCARRTTGEAKYDVPEDERTTTGIDAAITVDDQGYLVVDADDLAPVTADGAPSEPTTKYEARRVLEKLVDAGTVEEGACRVVCAHEAATEASA